MKRSGRRNTYQRLHSVLRLHYGAQREASVLTVQPAGSSLSASAESHRRGMDLEHSLGNYLHQYQPYEKRLVLDIYLPQLSNFHSGKKNVFLFFRLKL
ncbi:hypothetical protein NPIL_177351 [Nephila pilipes]|uniref:Uncharacterized protein n=1 Tax=Nephila pilipes TaxID=299642 RepID=A0A8X6U7K1_NEPPI|nr:hypothetical protein NPIL_177351 [Nephila pilipes]